MANNAHWKDRVSRYSISDHRRIWLDIALLEVMEPELNLILLPDTPRNKNIKKLPKKDRNILGN